MGSLKWFGTSVDERSQQLPGLRKAEGWGSGLNTVGKVTSHNPPRGETRKKYEFVLGIPEGLFNLKALTCKTLQLCRAEGG